MKIKRPAVLLLGMAAAMTALTGCGMSEEKADEAAPTASRSVDAVDSETKKVSSQILDLIAIEGEVSKGGPGVSSCDDKDRDKFFKLRHPWSVTGSSNQELEEAMLRLKEELPEHGWEIVDYGPNNSKNKSLELTADHHEKKFAVNAVLMANHGGDESPLLAITVVSACYEVPDGEQVDHY